MCLFLSSLCVHVCTCMHMCVWDRERESWFPLPPCNFSSRWNIFICKCRVTTQCMTLIHEVLLKVLSSSSDLLISLPIFKKWYFSTLTYIYKHMCVFNICIFKCVHIYFSPFAAHQMQSRHTSGFYQLGSSFKHILLNCLFPKAIPTYSVNVIFPPTVMFLIGPQIFP